MKEKKQMVGYKLAIMHVRDGHSLWLVPISFLYLIPVQFTLSNTQSFAPCLLLRVNVQKMLKEKVLKHVQGCRRFSGNLSGTITEELN